MTNCKFFQQGNCRFGQSCRFKHVYGSQYTYVANTQSHTATADVLPPQLNDVQALAQVLSDVPALLQGRQWILSVYAPFKDKPNFPGFIDLSPEETRLFMYEAKATNNFNQAVEYVNNLLEEARFKYEQLVRSPPSPAIIKTIRALNNGETPPSPFTNNIPASQTNASSVFKSAVQGSVFNQNNTNNVFAPSAAKSIFSQANQSVFSQNKQTKDPSSIFAEASQNMFNSQPSSSPNIFQQPNLQNAVSNTVTQPVNIFAQAQNSSPDADAFFKKPPTHTNIQTNNLSPATPVNMPVNIFTKANADADTFFRNSTQNNNQPNIQSTSKPSNIFAKANANIFGINNNEQANHEGNIYSEIEQLSKDDIDAFNDEDFKFGFIPELAPPKALCL